MAKRTTTRLSSADAMDALDTADVRADVEPTKRYMIFMDGTIIDGVVYKIGQVVSLDPAIADSHRDRGICLGDVPDGP